MKYKGRERSRNVQDRRGGGKTGMALGGGAIIIVIIALLLGQDPAQLLEATQSPVNNETPYASTAEEDELMEFIAVALKDNEDVWHALFEEEFNRQYEEPQLIVFKDRVQSACGMASAATGPFYCPGDDNVYLDLGFFDELSHRFGAPGDFAIAYVIAHEVGHHVQHLLGITGQVDQYRGKVSEKEYNALSVRLELQAPILIIVALNNWQPMKFAFRRSSLFRQFVQQIQIRVHVMMGKYLLRIFREQVKVRFICIENNRCSGPDIVA